MKPGGRETNKKKINGGCRQNCRAIVVLPKFCWDTILLGERALGGCMGPGYAKAWVLEASAQEVGKGAAETADGHRTEQTLPKELYGVRSATYY